VHIIPSFIYGLMLTEGRGARSIRVWYSDAREGNNEIKLFWKG